MKVLFDTNIIIDIWQQDPRFFLQSFAAYDVCMLRAWEACIAVTSVPDIEYLLVARRVLPKREIAAAMEKLLSLFTVIDAQQCDCICAHQSVAQGAMPDLEDGIIAYSAQRNGVDALVTRNTRDFKQAPVPALEPEEFVRLYKPAGAEYSLEEF